jgi:hypothetical protein
MMHYLDGYQALSLVDAKNRIKRNIPLKERKYFYVVKDERPIWYSGPWKQTYTIRVKDYSKIKVIPNY